MTANSHHAIDFAQLHRLVCEGPTILYVVRVEAGRPAITWISDNVTRILGHALEDAMDPAWWRRHIHPEDDAWFTDYAPGRSRAAKEVYRYRLRAADGSYRWLRDEHRTMTGGDRTNTTVFGSIVDVTAEVQAQEITQNARDQLAHAIESLSELVVLYDPDDRMIFANPAADAFNGELGEMWQPGVSYEEFLRAGLNEDLFPEARGRESDWLAERLHWHRNPSGPIEVIRQRDQILLVQEERLADGCTISISTDISDLKAAELAVKQSEQRHRGLIQQSPHGVIVHRDGKALFANQAMADILGYSTPRDIVDLDSIDAYVAPEEIARTRRYAQGRLDGKNAPTDYDFRALRADGREAWINCRPIVVDWDGAPAIQSVMFDVTDKIVAQQQRDEANQQLRAAHDLLHDAMESLPTAFALFDSDDRLVLHNENFPNFTPTNADLVKAGVEFKTLVRAGIERGHSIYEGESIDQIVSARVAHHRAGGNLERQRTDGTWLLVNERPTRDGGVILLETDITALKTAENRLASHNRILELLATDTPLEELFAQLALEVETLIRESKCSILRLDEDGSHLRHLAAPSLPDFFNQEIDGLTIGPDAAWCGVSAHTGKPIIADDIAGDTRWAPWREVAGRAGLAACWSQPILSSSGEVLGTFALYHDKPKSPDAETAAFITSTAHLAAVAIEHHRTGAALRESEQRFRDFAYAAGDRMWETDTEHRITYLSGPMPNGLPVSKLLGMRRWEIPGIDEADPAWNDYRMALHKRQPLRGFRYRWQRPGGTICVYEVNGKPVYDDNGEWVGYRGTTTDATAEVKALERAKDAQAHLALAVENLAELFILCDARDRIVMANRAWRELNAPVMDKSGPGAAYIDHLRAALAAGLYPQAEGREEEWLANRLSTRQNPGLPFEVERQDGRCFLVHDERLPDGGLITISSDITDRKKTELAMRHARDQAESANRTKSQFLATMSHELRTPLNSIIGYSDLIKNTASADQQGQALKLRGQTINEAGRHLLQLINDILDISKIEAGKFQLNEELVDVKEAIEAAVRLVSERATAAEIALDIAVDPPRPGLVADSRRLKQMLLNLLSNAIEHTPSGGQISVQAEVSPACGSLTVSIADTGAGMPRDDIPKALTPFSQLETGFARRTEGTGLGLALTKELVELHGGALELDSDLGAGTTARLVFAADRTRSLV